MVFRALADPTRRALLDARFETDGQSVGDRVARLPDVTRVAVMQHLALLEEADLVSTERVGREKHHHLNPVPIALLADRWVSKYAQPFTRAVLDVRRAAESTHRASSDRKQP